MVPLLSLQGIRAGYNGGEVLHGISLSVLQGGITALLGANGAGKTTTLRAISGMCKVAGSIEYEGHSLIGRAPDEVARMGIAHVPEGRGTFEHLTVEENVRLGAYGRRDRSKMSADIERVYHYFSRLRDRRRQQAGTLSGGEQQMLALSRALMLSPRLLLLDEPSFGLAPIVVAEIFSILENINKAEHVGILLVEQNASIGLRLSDHACLLETGRVAIFGSTSELKSMDIIKQSYLGT